jgi:hypothetical protein
MKLSGLVTTEILGFQVLGHVHDYHTCPKKEAVLQFRGFCKGELEQEGLARGQLGSRHGGRAEQDPILPEPFPGKGH